jgi:hypothetical protein
MIEKVRVCVHGCVGVGVGVGVIVGVCIVIGIRAVCVERMGRVVCLKK